MRILIATAQVPFVRGGAEILAEGLMHALRTQGHTTEIVAITFKWYPPERILDHVLACRLLDVSESGGDPIDRVIGRPHPSHFRVERPDIDAATGRPAPHRPQLSTQRNLGSTGRPVAPRRCRLPSESRW